ncbi:MAG TPA: BTAD domain-containing putative transcriptional regulator [Candidatus Elarobacter sp.]|nr:BTAD domain-containing putative transcriptional regulator [Dongiaceae bacterium]HZW54536.1 BTAD domain-containing putative transcriptional regulator [Candidatus Elarobacter sp.]
MNAVLEIDSAAASAPAADAPVKLEVLSGRALVDGTEIVLTGPQRLLVCALAQCRHPMDREQLEALFWPDDEPERARNLLNIAVHRLRKRLGHGAIVQSSDGYRLGGSVTVDLWEIEAFAARFRAAETPDITTAGRWLAVMRHVCCGGVRRAADPDFVAALERRLLGAARDATDRLAENALAAHRPDVALALVRVTLDYDPCDERARELAIRAHLARGDRASAIREYRDYARTLSEELGLAPSFALHDLVAAAATAV